MKLKYYIVLALIVFFFFAEVIFSHSKRNIAKNNTDINIIPISHRLDNKLSDNKETFEVDRLIANFLVDKKINGASVAISKDGKLVYAKGFGYSDKENKEPVEPKHVFRIASVSKLITAVAIMQLKEEGKLSLEDTVFGSNGILNDSIYLNYTDPNYEKITIHNLLIHNAGWSRKNGDPVFMPLTVANKMGVEPPITEEVLIQYALSKKLVYTPGKRYNYSNLGYIILGEIIEKKSGMPYEEFVKFNILEPLEIYDMRIGKNFIEERLPNEVKYYDKESNIKVHAFDGSGKIVSQAYGGNNIKLLGPAGGWVGSAVELMKLVVAIDGYPDFPDILKPETIELMTNKELNSPTLIGWKGTDGYGNWWRTGTLSGTTALVLRQKNNINWVILLNTTTKRRTRIHSDISRLMFTSVATIENWPQEDLFKHFEPSIFQAQRLSN